MKRSEPTNISSSITPADRASTKRFFELFEAATEEGRPDAGSPHLPISYFMSTSVAPVVGHEFDTSVAVDLEQENRRIVRMFLRESGLERDPDA